MHVTRQMDPLLTSAASGMRARMESLDILANNLANVSTSGFKLDREAFNVYASADAKDGESYATLSPITERHATDLGQGPLTETGSPMNLALEGQGFLTVSTGDRLVYTRNGQLKIGKDGAIESADGYKIQNTLGKPLIVDPAVPIDVDREGMVRQGGQEIGQIQISKVDDASKLQKLGATYFMVADSSAMQKADAQVRQGYLEASNVNPADSSIRLVGVMRQFEMLQRAMQLGADMNRKTIDEVAKAS